MSADSEPGAAGNGTNTIDYTTANSAGQQQLMKIAVVKLDVCLVCCGHYLSREIAVV